MSTRAFQRVFTCKIWLRYSRERALKRSKVRAIGKLNLNFKNFEPLICSPDIDHQLEQLQLQRRRLCALQAAITICRNKGCTNMRFPLRFGGRKLRSIRTSRHHLERPEILSTSYPPSRPSTIWLRIEHRYLENGR